MDDRVEGVLMSASPADLDARITDEFRANEVHDETIAVVAEEATGEERERLFRRHAERFSPLTEYERRSDRVIPVIVLTPREPFEGRTP